MAGRGRKSPSPGRGADSPLERPGNQVRKEGRGLQWGRPPTPERPTEGLETSVAFPPPPPPIPLAPALTGSTGRLEPPWAGASQAGVPLGAPHGQGSG